jgi:hypothetical protein
MAEKTVEWNAFICYRGKSIGHMASQQIAEQIYGMIGTDPGYTPVFFAEGTRERFDFMKDLDYIIPNVKKFVIVLSTAFFSDFFGGKDNKEEKNPLSATRRELELAFRHHCDLFPIFSGEFSWAAVDSGLMAKLEEHFGKENMDSLRNTMGYVWNQGENRPGDVKEYLSKESPAGVDRFIRSAARMGDSTRDFELAVTEYAKRFNSDGVRTILLQSVEENLAAGRRNEAYAAFYTLMVMLRQHKNYTAMNELFQKYRESFQDCRSFDHLYVLYVTDSGAQQDPEKLLELTYRDRRSCSGNAGFVHQFAFTFAWACEQADPKTLERIRTVWGVKALNAAERAIKLDGTYAKYYCTRARIRAIGGDYAGASADIDMAIDQEDSTRRDYMIRLMDYRYYKLRIETEKRIAELRRELTRQ